MFKCSEYCVPLCDFCIYLDNSKEGKGFCRIQRKEKDVWDMCEEFYCLLAYQRDNWQ